MHPDNGDDEITSVELGMASAELVALAPPGSLTVVPPVLFVLTTSVGEAMRFVEELFIVAVVDNPSWVLFNEALPRESCKARRNMLNRAFVNAFTLACVKVIYVLISDTKNGVTLKPRYPLKLADIL